ncbi:MAG: hypothetical protein VXY94_09180, partial [Planctomycetota bacterium]|nr:hypothetical protein [Planctomycetota bacterium]
SVMPRTSSMMTMAAEYPELAEPTLRRFAGRYQLLKEILLTAILESGSPRSVEYASLFKDERDRTIRSLVLLVKAKSDEPLDEQELEELTLITTGGGRIDPTVRSIAGWLWLKRNDQVDKAMMEIMSDA